MTNYKLKEIAEFDSSKYSSKENWKYVNYLDTGSVTKGIIESIQYINLETDKLPTRARVKVKKNTIIYSTVRPNQEHYAIIKNVPDNFLVSTGFSTLDIVSSTVNPYYVYYLLTKKDVVERLSNIAATSTSSYPSITNDTIKELSFSFPSLNEQNRIIKLLNNLNEKIDLNNKICTNLEHQANLLYDYWFNQFEFPNEEGKPYKSSGGMMVWNEELKREVPEGWKTVKFGAFADFAKGKIPSSELSDEKDEINSTPYITIDVANYAKPMYCNPEKLIPLNGETIMVMDGAASGDVYIGNYGILGSTFSKISSNRKDISNALIYILLNKHSVIYKKANTGSTVPHANANFIKQMLIVLPEDCYTFSLQFTILYKKIENCRIENQELSSLRDWLLPMLMNGQMTIED